MSETDRGEGEGGGRGMKAALRWVAGWIVRTRQANAGLLLCLEDAYHAVEKTGLVLNLGARRSGQGQPRSRDSQKTKESGGFWDVSPASAASLDASDGEGPDGDGPRKCVRGCVLSYLLE